MKLDELLRLQPKLHQGPTGLPHSWQVSDDILYAIDKHVDDKSRTLEIGAGVSTILFALKGSAHRCIVPFEEETKKISSFCREHSICLDKVRFEIAQSEHVLPQLECEELDLILIDGAHGFPIPFIDWYYSANKLKVGGILIIDDTQIWTGHILKQFLMAEPEWELESDFPPRSVVFKKTRDGGFGKNEWDQPYVVLQTIDLLYPDYLDILLPCAPADLLLAKEREASKKFKSLPDFLHCFKKKKSVAQLIKANISPVEFNIDNLNSISQPFTKSGDIVLHDIANLILNGWAIDRRNKKGAVGVYLQIDEKEFPAEYGLERLDVAKAKGAQYQYSGFRLCVPISEIGAGKHLLQVKIAGQGLKTCACDCPPLGNISFIIE